MKYILLFPILFATHFFFGQQDLTLQCNYSYRFMEKIPYNQVFNFSISDSLMIHNVMDEYRNVTESQAYKIVEVEYQENQELSTLEYKITVKSGKTNMLWYYEYTVEVETGEVSLYVDDKPIKKSSNTVNNYLGTAVVLTPFQKKETGSLYDNIKAEGLGDFLYYTRLVDFNYHPDSAMNLLQQAIKNNLFTTEIEQASIYTEMGLIEFQKENYKEAIKHLTKSIKMGDESGLAHCIRGNAKVKIEKEKDACNDLEYVMLKSAFVWADSYEELYGLKSPEFLLIQKCNKN